MSVNVNVNVKHCANRGQSPAQLGNTPTHEVLCPRQLESWHGVADCACSTLSHGGVVIPTTTIIVITENDGFLDSLRVPVFQHTPNTNTDVFL